MTDEELGAPNLDMICAGLADRIARLKRAYNDEIDALMDATSKVCPWARPKPRMTVATTARN
jgi:hypothetical protein